MHSNLKSTYSDYFLVVCNHIVAIEHFGIMISKKKFYPLNDLLSSNTKMQMHINSDGQ